MPLHSQLRTALFKMFRKMEEGTSEQHKDNESKEHQINPSFHFNTGAPQIEKAVNIEAINPQGTSTCFKMKSNSTMDRLMNTYCSRENIPSHSVVFLHNGEIIEPHQTPESLNMKTDTANIIDILLEKDYTAHFSPSIKPSFHKSHSIHTKDNVAINKSATLKKSEDKHDDKHDNKHGDKHDHSEHTKFKKTSKLDKIASENAISRMSKNNLGKSKRTKKVIRSTDAIRMGSVAFISSCFGDTNVNNNNIVNNNDNDNNNEIKNKEEIFERQCNNALNNLKEKLEKLEMELKEVVRIRVYLLNISNFETFSSILNSLFGEDHPIVTAVEVSKLRYSNALLEIEADAVHLK